MKKKQNEIPTVNFGLLGEENYITDYVQVHNPKLQRIAKRLRGKTNDQIITAVASYVAKNIKYPLDRHGKPTAATHTKCFKWWNGLYLTDVDFDYGWLFPNQTVASEVKRGICFSSACLCTSLLRIKHVEAFTVLGVVLKTKGKRILGFHAWTETVKTSGEHIVIETTVHPKPAKLVPAKDMYGEALPVTYDPLAWFNEAGYAEDKSKAKKYEAVLNA